MLGTFIKHYEYQLLYDAINCITQEIILSKTVVVPDNC